MQFIQCGGQVLGNMSQEVAGHDKDLYIVRAVEHVVWQASVRQLIVVQIHRPDEREHLSS